MTKHYKDSMPKELGEQLNERKKQGRLKRFRNWLENVTKGKPMSYETWKQQHPQGTFQGYMLYLRNFNETKEQVERIRIQEKHVEEIDDEQRRLREIAKRIHDEDFPPEHWGVDLWNSEKRRKEANIH